MLGKILKGNPLFQNLLVTVKSRTACLGSYFLKPAAESAAPAMSQTAMSHAAYSPPKYLGKFSEVTSFSMIYYLLL